MALKGARKTLRGATTGISYEIASNPLSRNFGGAKHGDCCANSRAELCVLMECALKPIAVVQGTQEVNLKFAGASPPVGRVGVESCYTP